MGVYKHELEKFKSFYYNYNFNQIDLTQKDGFIYAGSDLLQDADGNLLGETENYLNVGYKLKGPISKLLSNLFPYNFIFKGKKVSSIESVFQAIKFKSVKEQNLVLKYSGLSANIIKMATNYDWKESGNVYWQGKPINRFSKEYENFFIELYVSALQNPLYRGVLKNVNKQILHSIGEVDKEKTVFSRYEFEKMLNALVDFVKIGK